MMAKRNHAVKAFYCVVITALLLTGYSKRADSKDFRNDYEVMLPEQQCTNNKVCMPVLMSGKTGDWANFTNRHGQWNVSIDKQTGTPHFAFGTPIRIDGYEHIDSANVEAAALQFLKENQELFNIDVNNIRLSRKDNVNGKWYLSFKQYYRGIEVLLAGIELRINGAGSVMAFDVEYFKDIAVRSEPSITPGEAAGHADDGMNVKGKYDKILASPKTFILPVRHDAGTDYHLVYNFNVLPSNEFSRYNTFVDAHSGAVVWRYNTVSEAVNIEVKGGVKVENANSKETVVPFPNMKFRVGNNELTTDKDGKAQCEITEKSTVEACLTGTWSGVICRGATTGSYHGSVEPGQPLSLIFDDSNSLRFERNQYYYLNHARDFFMKLDPQLTCLNKRITAILNFEKDILYGIYGNAMSFADTIMFVNMKDSTYRMADCADILYHEYGHSLNTLFYVEKGRYHAFLNSTCHEALADMSAAAVTGQHEMGLGVYNKDTLNSLRDLKNNCIYPDSLNGECHNDSRVFSGAMWDLKEKTSLELFTKLHHFARYGLPDSPDLNTAFYRWLIEILLVDDDDGNLANGTPHSGTILESFNKHNLGDYLFYENNFAHNSFEETDNTTEPYTIVFGFGNSRLIFNKPDSAVVYYKVYPKSGIPHSYAVKASADESGIGFTALIPPQAEFSRVQYYVGLYVKDNRQIAFFKTPDSIPYEFIVGYKTAHFDGFETATNWQVGGTDYDDPESVGQWERGTPVMIDFSAAGYDVLKPGDDHTTNGNYYCTTGLKSLPEGVKDSLTFFIDNVIPGATTTLTSPAYDLTGLENVCFKYYLYFRRFSTPWFLPPVPSLITQLSNDGGINWKTVKIDRTEGRSEWVKYLIKFNSYLNSSDKCMIRFQYYTEPGYDNNRNAYASVTLDDFSILTSNSKSLDAVDETGDGDNIIQACPNPFSEETIIKYQSGIACNSTVTIANLRGESVFGREARSVPGPNTFTWNGMDNNNLPVSAGVYIFRIVCGGKVYTGKLIRF